MLLNGMLRVVSLLWLRSYLDYIEASNIKLGEQQ